MAGCVSEGLFQVEASDLDDDGQTLHCWRKINTYILDQRVGFAGQDRMSRLRVEKARS